MKQEEYNARLEVIESEYKKKKDSLLIECAKSNSSLKKGDKVTDIISTIIIDRITFCPNGADPNGKELMPSCVYHGIQLNKDGYPKKPHKDNKDSNRRRVYQCNVEE